MDETVRQAMAKWPNVPAVFGWLSLDRRGAWLLKNEGISNPIFIDFIGRNYDHDAAGRWFFQNGPQRVFVELAYAPWVFRVTPEGGLVTHTGHAVARVDGLWFDEDGIVIVKTEHGPGVLDDRDLEAISPNFVNPDGGPLDEERLLESIEKIVAGEPACVEFSYRDRTVTVGRMMRAVAPLQLGFVREPEPEPLARDATH